MVLLQAHETSTTIILICWSEHITWQGRAVNPRTQLPNLTILLTVCKSVFSDHKFDHFSHENMNPRTFFRFQSSRFGICSTVGLQLWHNPATWSPKFRVRITASKKLRKSFGFYPHLLKKKTTLSLPYHGRTVLKVFSTCVARSR